MRGMGHLKFSSCPMISHHVEFRWGQFWGKVLLLSLNFYDSQPTAKMTWCLMLDTKDLNIHKINLWNMSNGDAKCSIYFPLRFLPPLRQGVHSCQLAGKVRESRGRGVGAASDGCPSGGRVRLTRCWGHPLSQWSHLCPQMQHPIS